MRKPSKKLLAARLAFTQRVENIILSHGAQKGRSYQWRLETKVGQLDVSIYDSWIACCFDDVERAKAWTSRHSVNRINPCSGKWNWIYFDDQLDHTCESRFASELRELMTPDLMTDDRQVDREAFRNAFLELLDDVN